MKRVPIDFSGALLGVACALLAGCNGGLAAAIGLSSESSSTDSPSTITAFAVVDAKESPATIRFRTVDANGDPLTVTLFFSLPGGSPEALTQLGGAANPASYAASAGGVQHTLSWDFAAEPGIAAGAGFTAGVQVWAQGPGGGAIVAGANAATVGLGNDAPVVTAVDVPVAESTGVVPIGVTVEDSSADLVSVRVEYEVAGAPGVWTLARPAGVGSTPALAIVDLSAPPGGVSTNFFWDTGADLPLLERDVRLRFTPTDGTVEGASFVSASLRVDNNERPLVDLDNGLIALGQNLDRLGGIALPFSLRDAESDRVSMVFQWRRSGEPFPTLPTDVTSVLAIQDDPALRAQYQVCTRRVSYVSGRPKAVDATHVRLPELGTSSVNLETPLLVGRDLELLRPAELAIDVTAGWSANPLVAPVAALPVGDGLEALVLDQPTAGTWRVQRIDVARGTALSTVAQGGGTPTAMALDATEAIAFVACDTGAGWQIDRVDVAAGASTGTVSGSFVDPGGVRGIAARSVWSAVFTVDDALWSAGFSGASPAAHELLDGLSVPFGVALDPLAQDVALVAETGADRVVAVDLERRIVEGDVVAPNPGTALDFPSPRGVAFDLEGVRLLVATETPGGQRELRAMNRRSPHDTDGDGFANPVVHVLTDLSATAGTSIGVGPDRLRLLSDPATDGLVAIGGLEQRRGIVLAAPDDNVVALDAPLEPPLQGPRRWRVERARNDFASTPSGSDLVFPWDSRDAPRGGDVLFRAMPYDSELGIEAETSVERTIDAVVAGRKAVLDANADGGIVLPVLVDFDRDGDLDVFLVEGADSRVLLQTAPRVFEPDPVPLAIDLSATVGGPVAFADLDADGELDLIHLRNDQQVEIFHGTGPGALDPVPVLLAIPGPVQTTPLVGHVEVCDIEPDGDLDLVVAAPTDEGGEMNEPILVFVQSAPGTFDPTPISVGGGGDTDNTRFVRVVDIDGDGLVDIAAGNTGTDAAFFDPGTISLHFQSAPGTFDPVPVVVGEPDPNGAAGSITTGAVRWIAFADLDADGDLDLVSAHGVPIGGTASNPIPALSGRVTVHWQTSPRVFDPVPLELRSPGSGQSGTGIFSVAVADMNGDGRDDVVAQSTEGIVVFFALETGDLDSTPLVVPYDVDFVLSPYGFGTHSFQPADVDGDGDLDVVHRSFGTESVDVLYQTGPGIETLSSTPTVLSQQGVTDGAIDAVAADLDGDGDLDLGTANGGLFGIFSTLDFKVFFQSSPRTFVSTPVTLDGGSVTTTTNPVWVDAADLDQDGDRDLLGLTMVHEILVFPQQGGVFADPTVITGYGPMMGQSPFFNTLTTASVLDMDEDGDLDLLANASVFEAAFGFEQVSPGAFVEAFRFEHSTELDNGVMPRTVGAADLDEDGDLELLLGTEPGAGFTGSLLVFDGTGPNQFDPTPTDLGGGAVTVVTADVDGDGDLDIVATPPTIGVLGCDATDIVVFLRNDTGTYDPVMVRPGNGCPASIPGGSGVPIFRLADVDLDGDLDFLTLDRGVSLGSSEGPVIFVEQVAPGVFSSHPPLTTEGATSIFLDDVDGDGELDVLITEFATAPPTNFIRVYWGNDR